MNKAKTANKVNENDLSAVFILFAKMFLRARNLPIFRKEENNIINHEPYFIAVGDSFLGGTSDFAVHPDRSLEDLFSIFPSGLNEEEINFLQHRAISCVDLLNYAFQEGFVNESLLSPLARVGLPLPLHQLVKAIRKGTNWTTEYRVLKELIKIAGGIPSTFYTETRKTDINAYAKLSLPGAKLSDALNMTYESYKEILDQALQDLDNKSKRQFTLALIKTYRKLGSMQQFLLVMSGICWNMRGLQRYKSSDGQYLSQIQYLLHLTKNRMTRAKVVEITLFGNESVTGPILHGRLDSSEELCKGLLGDNWQEILFNEFGEAKYGYLSNKHFKQQCEKLFKQLFESGHQIADIVVINNVPVISQLGLFTPTEGAELLDDGYYSSYSLYASPTKPAFLDTDKKIKVDADMMRFLDSIVSGHNKILEELVNEYSAKGARLFDVSKSTYDIQNLKDQFTQSEFESIFEGVDTKYIEMLKENPSVIFSLDGFHPNQLAHFLLALKKIEMYKNEGIVDQKTYDIGRERLISIGNKAVKAYFRDTPFGPGRLPNVSGTFQMAAKAVSAARVIA